MPTNSTGSRGSCRSRRLALRLAAAWFVAAWLAAPARAERAELVIDMGDRRQTMRGWEAVARVGGEIPPARVESILPQILERAAGELGIDRLRVEVPCGLEGADDSWPDWREGTIDASQWRARRRRSTNDDADPRTIRSEGFQWGELDWKISRIVLPLRALLAERGERLVLVLAYQAPAPEIGRERRFHLDPEEYAEFALAVHLHLRDRHALAPDLWEPVLEPDLFQYEPELLASAMAATRRRLLEAGFETRFVAPSTRSGAAAIPYLESIAAEPQALAGLAEISYHLYGDPADRESTGGELARRAAELGVPLAMLERPGLTHSLLARELAATGASSISQFLLAGTAPDDGAQHFLVDLAGPDGPTAILGKRSRLLAPFFLSARRGAVRVGARSEDPAILPVAFVDPAGSPTIVLSIEEGASRLISIRGLPPGSYESWFVLPQIEGTLPASSIAREQPLEIPNPGAGVLVVRAAGGPDPDPLPAPDPPARGGRNLVQNPGFERADASWGKVSADWTGTEPIEDDRVRTQRHGGEFSLQLAAPSREDRMVEQRIDSIVPGARYRWSAWVKTRDMPQGAVRLDLTWYRREGQSWKWLGKVEACPTGPADDWTLLGPILTIAPEGANTARIRITVGPDPDPEPNGLVWFDDVVLELAGE